MGVREEEVLGICYLLQKALPREAFMSFSRFLLAVVHNVVLQPANRVFRRMRTNAKV
jgi:hypothetical protein